MDFAVPAEHSVKFKENEKWVKYLDFAKKVKEATEPKSNDVTDC